VPGVGQRRAVSVDPRDLRVGRRRPAIPLRVDTAHPGSRDAAPALCPRRDAVRRAIPNAPRPDDRRRRTRTHPTDLRTLPANAHDPRRRGEAACRGGLAARLAGHRVHRRGQRRPRGAVPKGSRRHRTVGGGSARLGDAAHERGPRAGETCRRGSSGPRLRLARRRRRRGQVDGPATAGLDRRAERR